MDSRIEELIKRVAMHAKVLHAAQTKADADWDNHRTSWEAQSKARMALQVAEAELLDAIKGVTVTG